MKPVPLVLLIAGSFLFPFIYPRHYVHGVSAASNANEASFVIAGYLPDYRAYININATAIHLTDMMLFSLTPESVQQAYSSPPGGCCLSSDHYDKIRKAKSYKREQQHSKKIRLLLTIGGAGRSNGFRDIVTGDPQTQRQFIKSLVQLCHDEDLDGIDLDFEGIQSLVEWNSYLKFLSTSSTYLHRHGLLLTVALHPGQLLSSDVCQSMDRVHIMTYDMMHSSQPSSDKRTNHHASIHSVHQALSKFIRNGCHPSKLVMGIPAYGRHKQNTGLVQTYSEIVDDIMKNNNDSKEISNSIQSMHTWKGYQFDSPDDVQTKVKYAMQKGLGGVFIWELGQDKQIADVAEGGILLEAAASSAANLGIGMSDDGHEGGRKHSKVPSPAKEEL